MTNPSETLNSSEAAPGIHYDGNASAKNKKPEGTSQTANKQNMSQKIADNSLTESEKVFGRSTEVSG